MQPKQQRALEALVELGGRGTARQIAREAGDLTPTAAAMALRFYGYATLRRDQPGRPGEWLITPEGIQEANSDA